VTRLKFGRAAEQVLGVWERRSAARRLDIGELHHLARSAVYEYLCYDGLSPRAAWDAADAAPNSRVRRLSRGVFTGTASGRGPMSVRETVRDAQRRLAALDADYACAIAKFIRACPTRR
jgi:hypothetical protein